MQTVLLFTDEHALARQEIVQLGGTVDQRHHHSAMIVSLPRSILPPSYLIHPHSPLRNMNKSFHRSLKLFRCFNPLICYLQQIPN